MGGGGLFFSTDPKCLCEMVLQRTGGVPTVAEYLQEQEQQDGLPDVDLNAVKLDPYANEDAIFSIWFENKE